MPARALRTLTISLLIAIFFSLLLASNAAAAGKYVVLLRDGASPTAAAKRHGAAPQFVYGSSIRGYAAFLSDAALARATADPSVIAVSIDRVVRVAKPGGGPGGGGGGGGSTTPAAQTVPTGIRRIGGEPRLANVDYSVQGLVDVAVVDSGIDLDHPDLNARSGANCSSGASADDGNGHGTHVAGTIAAKDDSRGVVGVAPGATVWAYRVLNNAGSGTTSSVICGLARALDNPSIDVVNMSIGGAGSVTSGTDCFTTNDAYYIAICDLIDAGITVVVAAGNDAKDASGTLPAAYPEAITVSAWADFDGTPGTDPSAPKCRADEDESFANFSNYGSIVDIAAPGVCILSTWKGGGYNTISGTSMASPHVAGAAALWRATHAGADVPSTEAGLKESATAVSPTDIPGDQPGVGAGLLSVVGGGW